MVEHRAVNAAASVTVGSIPTIPTICHSSPIGRGVPLRTERLEVRVFSMVFTSRSSPVEEAQNLKF
jgi:hypothetical protein